MTWPEIAKAAELVNFSLISCCSRKTQQQIFYRNSIFQTEHIKLIELDYNFLLQLNPPELFYNYQLIRRNLKINKFAEIDSGKSLPCNSLKFHPTLSLCAVICSETTFKVLAYNRDSQLRRKCWATGILYRETLYEYISILDLQWSPRGTFLSVIAGHRPHFDAVTDLSVNCQGGCNEKYIHLYYLDLEMGDLKKIHNFGQDWGTLRSPTAPILSCQWHQCCHIWNDDNIITLYNHKSDSLERLVFNIQEKIFTSHSLHLKPKLFLNQFNEKLICSMAHPNRPDVVILQSLCCEKFHYHHRLFLYNLASETIEYSSFIPGIIFDILLDNDSDCLIIFYYIFDKFQYVPSKDCLRDPMTCPFEQIQTNGAQYYHHYVRQTLVYNGENTLVRLRSIDLKNQLEKELIHPEFDQHIEYHYGSKPKWYLWFAGPEKKCRYLTNQHVIMNNPNGDTYKIGRFHVSLMTISRQFKSSVQASKDVWAYHPEETIFATLNSNFPSSIVFYYCPEIMNPETKSAFYKKYLALQKDRKIILIPKQLK